MANNTGLQARLWKAFVTQAIWIGLAAILGVYAARFILSDVLIKRALEDEAAYFWSKYEQQADFRRPDTNNLTGYLVPGDQSLPAHLLGLEAGFHKLPKEAADLYIVYVSARGDRRLFLEFDGRQVGELAFFFGIAPLIGVLIVIYLSSWLAYRGARRAVSPLVRLAKIVEKFDPKTGTTPLIDERELAAAGNREVIVLTRALSDLLRRIESFVERERNFTRDASHELRSPITVIKIAADMLLGEQRLDPDARRSVEKIKRNANDMEALIEALLLLAREADDGLALETVCINEIVTDQIERAQLLNADKPISVDQQIGATLTIKAPRQVLSVLVGNIVRNAFSYTDQGSVSIGIDDRRLVIEDSGIGIAVDEVDKIFRPFYRAGGKQRGGHGVGLTIVKMLSERFNWPVSIDSKPGIGTRITVMFPQADSRSVEDLARSQN